MKARVWSNKHNRYFYHGEEYIDAVHPVCTVEIVIKGNGDWGVWIGQLGNATWPMVTMADGVLEWWAGCQDRDKKDIYQGDVVHIPKGWDGDYSYKEHISTVELREDWHPAAFYIEGNGSFHDCKVVRSIHEPKSQFEIDLEKRQLDVAEEDRRRHVEEMEKEITMLTNRVKHLKGVEGNG